MSDKALQFINRWTLIICLISSVVSVSCCVWMVLNPALINPPEDKIAAATRNSIRGIVDTIKTQNMRLQVTVDNMQYKILPQLDGKDSLFASDLEKNKLALSIIQNNKYNAKIAAAAHYVPLDMSNFLSARYKVSVQ